MPGADEACATVQRVSWRAGVWEESCDEVVEEAALQIQIGGLPYAVIMRTPGHDEDLVRGFLWTEGVVDDISAIRSVRHCTSAGAEAAEHVVQVILHDEAAQALAPSRRHLVVNASCGLCGRGSLDAILAELRPLVACEPALDPQVISGLTQALTPYQSLFRRTGGCHAAALCDREGKVLVVREDVGRHNALDKVLGWYKSENGPQHGAAIAVLSGRISAELVQKANRAQIPLLVAVSAPSSLAIEMAAGCGMTLVGFARRQEFNVYAGPMRLQAKKVQHS